MDKVRLIMEKEGKFKTLDVVSDGDFTGFKIVGAEVLLTETTVSNTSTGVTTSKKAGNAKKTTSKKSVTKPKDKVTDEDIKNIDAKKDIKNIEADIKHEDVIVNASFIKGKMADCDKGMDDVQKMYKSITGDKSKDDVKLNMLSDDHKALIPQYIEDNWE